MAEPPTNLEDWHTAGPFKIGEALLVLYSDQPVRASYDVQRAQMGIEFGDGSVIIRSDGVVLRLPAMEKVEKLAPLVYAPERPGQRNVWKELGLKEPTPFMWWWMRRKHGIATRLRRFADRLDGGDPKVPREAVQLFP